MVSHLEWAGRSGQVVEMMRRVQEFAEATDQAGDGAGEQLRRVKAVLDQLEKRRNDGGA
jgi:hypothetical protein